MSATIRPRTEADIPALAEVLVRVHAQDGYPVEGVANPEAWLSSDRELGAWTAEVDSQPVGQVMLVEPGPGDEAATILARRVKSSKAGIGVVSRLFVDPAARGRKISEELVRCAISEAQSSGRSLVLDVMEKDQAAVALYRRMGWREIGRFSHSCREGSVPAIAFQFPTSNVE